MLCQFVEAAQFDNLGVFTYSDEDTSASYALDGKVDGRTIHNRKRRLMAIQRKIARRPQSRAGGRGSAGAGEGPLAGNRSLVGSPHADPGAGDRRRHHDQRFRRPEPRPGEIRRLRITEAHDYDVMGTCCCNLTKRRPALRPRS